MSDKAEATADNPYCKNCRYYKATRRREGLCCHPPQEWEWTGDPANITSPIQACDPMACCGFWQVIPRPRIAQKILRFPLDDTAECGIFVVVRYETPNQGRQTMSCTKQHYEKVSEFLGFDGDLAPLMDMDQSEIDDAERRMKEAELTADGFPPQCVCGRP